MSINNEHLRELGEMSRFISFTLENLGYWKNMEESYEHTERMHELYFGKKKFANYETFRSAKSQYLKKLKGH